MSTEPCPYCNNRLQEKRRKYIIWIWCSYCNLVVDTKELVIRDATD